MLSPLPRRSHWRPCIAHPSSDVSLPRYGSRVGLRIVLFEACSAFTRVTACTLALTPYFVTRLPEGFRHFVSSMPAPVASGWSIRRVGLAPTGKRRLSRAHTTSGLSEAPRRVPKQPSVNSYGSDPRVISWRRRRGRGQGDHRRADDRTHARPLLRFERTRGFQQLPLYIRFDIFLA
jgi:hypothetical protein